MSTTYKMEWQNREDGRKHIATFGCMRDVSDFRYGLYDGLGKELRLVRIEYDFWHPNLKVINF